MTLKTIAASTLGATILLILLAWLAIPHNTGAQTGDNDTDNDGLIEIHTLEQLNAIRWDLDGDGNPDSQDNQDAYAAAFPNAENNMGCSPISGCHGYELARSLDFDDPNSYASGEVSTRWTEGEGWLPIGIGSTFRAEFDGNDHTIANLYINRIGRTAPGVTGLFGYNNGHINRIGLIDLYVTGVNNVGGLVGYNIVAISASYATGNVSGSRFIGGLVGTASDFSTITASYSTGNVSGDGYVGGLVGYHLQGTIGASYATGNVSGDEHIGGLVGYHSQGTIIRSYAIGHVSGGSNIGGLVGINADAISGSYATGHVSGDRYVGGLTGLNAYTIRSSYTTVSVSGNEYVGGLIGYNHHSASVQDVSYWDTQTSGQSSGVGRGWSNRVKGKTTAELQSPTGYTGIYAGWLSDFDNADEDFDDTTGVDDLWDFGTSRDYPALKADTDGDGVPTWQEFGSQRGQSPTDAPPPTPTPIATPTPTATPTPPADLSLTMLSANHFGFQFHYLIVENNGPSDATEVVLAISTQGVPSALSVPTTGTCSEDPIVTCELGNLAPGSQALVMILGADSDSSQSAPRITANVQAAQPDPNPANNEIR